MSEPVMFLESVSGPAVWSYQRYCPMCMLGYVGYTLS